MVEGSPSSKPRGLGLLHTWTTLGGGWLGLDTRQLRTTGTSTPYTEVIKGFQKRVSHQSPVLLGTVLLRGPGCRMGYVKGRHLNQKVIQLTHSLGERNSDNTVVTLLCLRWTSEVRPAVETPGI